MAHRITINKRLGFYRAICICGWKALTANEKAAASAGAAHIDEERLTSPRFLVLQQHDEKGFYFLITDTWHPEHTFETPRAPTERDALARAQEYLP